MISPLHIILALLSDNKNQTTSYSFINHMMLFHRKRCQSTTQILFTTTKQRNEQEDVKNEIKYKGEIKLKQQNKIK
jgi:hypothetical protein